MQRIKIPPLTIQLALAILLLDQFTKWLAIEYLKTPISLFPGVSLRFEQNFGIAWSIPIPFTILILLNIILLFLVPYFIITKFKIDLKKTQIFLGFLVGGALGNIIDRLRLGYVVDFLSFGTFPVFNIADSFITISIFLILVFYDKIAGSPN